MKYFFSSESVDSIINGCGSELNVFSIKGSCPLLKSKALYEIANEASNNGLSCEKFLSPFDYDKLAGVYIKGKNSLIYDSEYYTSGFCETKTFDIDEIGNSGVQSKRIAESETKKNVFLSCFAKEKNTASILQKENDYLIMKYISKPKILNYILRFISRNKFMPTERTGTSSVRSLSAITAWGVHCLYETVLEDCNRIFTVSGKIKHINSLLISGLAEAFVQYGYDVTVFKCSLTGEAEHLCIPALSLAFLSDNDYHTLPYGQSGEIRCERFLRSKIPENIRFQTVLNNEQIDDCIGKAVFAMFDALEIQNTISDVLFDKQNENFANKLQPMIIKAVLGNN